MSVYTKDADTLTAWVAKHSDSSCGLANGTGFFWHVTNLSHVIAAGRDAVAFDEDVVGCAPPLTIHTTAFVLGSAHVFTFDWWSSDPNYAPTVQAVAERMLASFTS